MQHAVVNIGLLTPGETINARRHGGKEGLAELVASIKAHGLLQPLVVRKDGERFEVIDGNRRLAALQKAFGKKGGDVDVMVADADDTDALDASLAANVIRKAMHPVDEYRAFARLIEGGQTADQIAKAFNLKPGYVNQRMGLAKIAPALLDDWLAGGMTEEQAAAFTISDDHAAQEKVWQAAKKQPGEYYKGPQQLRRELQRTTGLLDETSPEFKLIGANAYEAAGGTFRGDLFSDHRFPDNNALVVRLAGEIIAAKKAEVAAEGWAFVATPFDEIETSTVWIETLASEAEKADLAKSRTWQAQEVIRVAIRTRCEADPDIRAQYGAEIRLSHDGALSVSRIVKRAGDDVADDDDEEDARQPAPTPAAAPEKPKNPLSASVKTALSEVLTVAFAETLAKQPTVALPALIATLEVRVNTFSEPAPLRIREDSWVGLAPARPETFDGWGDIFARTRKIPLERQLERLAEIVAKTLDLRWLKMDPRNGFADARDAIIAETADALPADVLNSAINKHFVPTDYFAKVPAALCIEALDEMEGKQARSTKKADLVANASTKAAASGWLPKDLRTAHYTGPSAATEVA